ncbi:MAG: cyclic nucleotide-binding domain-containing protein, partial [Pseudomonadota bacterium]
MERFDDPPETADGLSATRPGGAYQRTAQIFPTLTDEQLARCVPFGERKLLPKGTMVFRRGERTVDCFIILRGTIEIVDPAQEDLPVITVHRARNFTGELDLFNN